MPVTLSFSHCTNHYDIFSYITKFMIIVKFQELGTPRNMSLCCKNVLKPQN